MKKTLIVAIILFQTAQIFASVLDRKTETLATEIALQYKKEHPDLASKTALAIIPFQNRGKEAKNGFVGEAVTASLKIAFKNNLIFYSVDRENLPRMLKEIELSQTGLVDEKSQARLGAIEGIQFFLVGEITEDADNFIITAQLLDVSTSKVLTSAKTSLDKRTMVKDSEKYTYEYIAANGIGITYNTGSKMIDFMDKSYQVVDGGATGQSVTFVNLSYRLHRFLKISGIYNQVNLGDAEYVGQEVRLQDAKNIRFLENVTNYHYWDHGVIITNGFANLKMQPDYSLHPEVTTFSVIPRFVYPLTRRLSLSAGAGPQFSLIKYFQRFANAPHLVEGAVEYRDLNIVNETIGTGVLANGDIEFFFLPRLALNVGCTFVYMAYQQRGSKAIINGTTYYRNAEGTDEGYGWLINDRFGYDPFRTFNGEDVYVKTSYFQVNAGLSFYF